ncbi:MAG: arsenate reductase ArsC [Gemmatimonadaceae bacterium]|nr:arsenate reductase ArsC [Gemmatimonadaceae bacterium]
MTDSTSKLSQLRVLFVCTHNRARSQMAEALMQSRIARVAPGRFAVGSAGSHPGSEVHPMAVEVLRDAGIDWRGHRPRSIDDVIGERWDLVITVCDRAKASCPIVPGHPAFAHWGMDDPSEVEGDDSVRAKAFRDTLQYLGRRIDLLLALPFESLASSVLERRVQSIAEDVPVPRHVAP